MPKFTAISLIILISFTGFQANSKGIPYLRPANNISLNLFGDASIIAVNYERVFASYRKFFMNGKLGIGFSESTGLPVNNTSLISTPLHITGNYGRKKQYFEFGLGCTFLFYEQLKYWDFSLYPIIGYRVYPLKKDKVTFRIFASYPLTDKIDMKNYWFFPVGISLGFSF